MKRPMRRMRLALAAALLATGTPMLLAGPAQAADEAVEDATFTWKVSDYAFTGHLSGGHKQSGDVEKVPDVGFRWTGGDGVVDPVTGAVDVTFDGVVTLGPGPMMGGYEIELSDPEVTVDEAGNGSITVGVAWCTSSCSDRASFTDAGRVLASSFTTAGPSASGTTLTWTETPIAEPVPGDTSEPPRVQFPQALLDALAPATPSLLGHFRQTGSGSDATKPPAPFTLTTELAAPAAPIRPEGDLDDAHLAWSVSEYAWTVPSLAGWSSAGAPAVMGTSAYEFSAASGTYDPDTGELAAAFDGTIYLGNDYGTAGYRIAFDQPTILIDAAGEGRLLADVTSCVFGQGAPATACDGFESVTGPQVELVTFTVGDDDVVVDGDSVTWTVTPDWEPSKSFSAELLEVLPASVRSFFYETGTNPTSDAMKRAAAFTLRLGLPADPGGEGPGGEEPGQTPGGGTPGEETPLPSGTIVDGELVWGIKDSFRQYLVGPIAHGTVTPRTPATQAPGNGPFTFPLSGEGTFASAADLAATFAGGAHLWGHDGELDVTFEDPEVVIEGTTGRLIADIEANEHGTDAQYDEEDVVVATLDLSAVTPTRVGDTVTYAGIPATLTADGEIGFSGYYRAGDALDPVTLVLTVEGADLGGIGAPDPDADKVTCTPTGTVPAGSEIRVCGSGFLPGEQVLVLLHSTPVQLAVVTADAHGAVDAQVTIPATAAAGEHRIELRGVTSGRSIFSDPFTVVAQQGGALPRTGDDSGPLVRLGLGLLAIGALATGVAQRRRVGAAR